MCVSDRLLAVHGARLLAYAGLRSAVAALSSTPVSVPLLPLQRSSGVSGWA
jgi:hypothetical protein